MPGTMLFVTVTSRPLDAKGRVLEIRTGRGFRTGQGRGTNGLAGNCIGLSRATMIPV
jgi:hypothetical protein